MAEEKAAPNKVPSRPTRGLVTKNPDGQRYIMVEGVKYPAEVEQLRTGQTILKKSIYREVRLPNSKKITKVLVAAKGTEVRAY